MKKVIYLAFFLLLGNFAKSQALSDADTKAIFNFLYGSGAASDMTINAEDRQKAQMFLNELVDGSCKMSIVQALFDAT
ncbi:MAG TPA: hypothetical protein VKH37_00950, partial [Ferruginibacter sp.]|nr:hypothetical protein [Ferruginibacter sp.]